MHLQLWWVAGVIGLYALTVVLGSEWSLRLCYRRFSVATVAIVGSLTIAVSVSVRRWCWRNRWARRCCWARGWSCWA